MKKLSNLIALLLALCMVFALCACGKSETTAEESAKNTSVASTEDAQDAPKEEGPTSITVGSVSNSAVVSLDPINYTGVGFSYPLSYLCYDALFYVDPETNEMTSDILADWHYEEGDYTTLYLTLKDNVTFSNGDKMDGEDILYSLYLVSIGGRMTTYFEPIDFDASKTSEDGLTVTLKYKYEYGPGIKNLKTWIVNKDFIESNGGADNFDWYDPSLVCGSGAYALTDFVTDISMKFELRDDWWNAENERPGFCSVDEIEVLKYSDASTMIIDFENGVIDLALDIAKDDINRIDDGGMIGEYNIINANDVVIIGMDKENNEYLANADFRAALCYSLDIAAIAQNVYGKLAIPATSTLASTLACYVGDNAYEYDLDLAKEYMEKSGFSDVTLKCVCTNASVQSQLMEIVQNYWAAIGVTLDLQIVDQATAIPLWIEPGNSDVMRMADSSGSMALEPTKSYSAFQADTIFTPCRRTDAEIVELMDEGLYNVDESIRNAAYAELQTYFHDNYELIPICEWCSAYCYNPETITSCVLTSCYEPDIRFIEAK